MVGRVWRRECGGGRRRRRAGSACCCSQTACTASPAAQDGARKKRGRRPQGGGGAPRGPSASPPCTSPGAAARLRQADPAQHQRVAAEVAPPRLHAGRRAGLLAHFPGLQHVALSKELPGGVGAGPGVAHLRWQTGQGPGRKAAGCWAQALPQGAGPAAAASAPPRPGNALAAARSANSSRMAQQQAGTARDTAPWVAPCASAASPPKRNDPPAGDRKPVQCCSAARRRSQR